MQQKLLRKTGMLGFVVTVMGVLLVGCLEEPTIPVIEKMTSPVRYVMAIPDAPALDLWVDSVRIAQNLKYKDVLPYTTINSGDRWYRLVPANQDTSKAIFRAKITVRSLTKITTVFAGSAADPGLLDTQERFTYSNESAKLHDSTDVKLINVNMSVGEVDLIDVITGGDVARITKVNSGSLSGYKKINSGSHKFTVVTSTGSIEVIPNFETVLTTGYRHSYILVGDASSAELLKLQDDPY